MVSVVKGDLLASNAQTIVNTVNCVGVMGKGIALQFKRRFPEMFRDYEERCQAGTVQLGRPYLFKRSSPPWILNFPTKDHWRSPSRLDAIEEGLRFLRLHYSDWGITSLAVPPLGCGHGGLDWRIVGPTLYHELKTFDIPVELYAPFETPHAELQPEYLERLFPDDYDSLPESSRPAIQPAWVALAEVLHRVDLEPYHPPLGRIAMQKLAYFATVSGLPTGLNFAAASYGPFAADLKPHLARLINNGVILEERRGQMFVVRPGPTFSDARKAYADSLNTWESVIERLVDLFSRLRGTRQAELAATVHFAAHNMAQKSGSAPPAEKEVFRAVMDWKQRRDPPFGEREVATAVRTLTALGWLELAPSPDLPLDDPVLAELA